jgi:alkylation response protein AidB-like acyl-CoA dehydrogenase
MKLEISAEQSMLRETVGRAMAALRDPVRIRQAEAEGFDRLQWEKFRELGLPLLRAKPSQGGAGLGLLEAVLVSEAVAEALALIPVVDSLAAMSLLSAINTERTAELVRAAGEGGIIALSLHDASTTPSQFLMFGAAADVILYRHGDAILARAGANGASPSLGGTASSLIDFHPEDDETLGTGPLAIAQWEAAVEEWKLCNAASIAAMARQSLLEASAYACEREAFGRKIGGFQGLSHPLADSLADVDGATLLVWRAVENIARASERAAAMASQAVWWTIERCGVAARRAMRVFGGYGMTMEYDAQIFFRRIAAQSVAPGDPQRELDRAGRRLFLGERASLPNAGEVAISFEFDRSAQEVVELTREVFKTHVTPERAQWSFRTEDGYDPVLYAALAAKGVLYPDWPREFGGLGGNAEMYTAAESVFNEFDWAYSIITVTSLFGKILMRFGSSAAQAEILPKFAAGKAVGALCYSEPSSGSDIFAARTRARREDDDWIVEGQKIFTSQGHIADYGLMLARTGDGPKHQSITLFALPLKLQGYRCEPIRTIGGERTNVTFYDGMRVSDSYRLGEVNGGTKILAAALALEQCASELYVGKIAQLLDNALEWTRGDQRLDLGAAENVGVLRRFAHVATCRDVTDVLSRRAVAASINGTNRKHFGPMGKLFGSEAWVECSKIMLEIVAPTGLIFGGTPLGRIEKSFRQSIPGTIYAGTSEIQRSLIAEAGLNLPRSRS